MPIKPLYDRVLVRRVEEEEEKIGSIIIPDTAKEKPQEGIVIAVGEGKVLDNGERVAPSVGEGDTILFGKYSGTEVKYEGTEYLIMREEDILAKIVNE
jgi:chaperonin GroES